MTSRPVSADPRVRQYAARLAATRVPLPRTAAGRTPRLSAEQLAVVYDRMYSQAEERELKAKHKEEKQRRAIREQCTCVRKLEKQRAIVERLAIEDVSERRVLAQARTARTDRVLAAQQLCNVVALGRDAKIKLHEGRQPSAPLTPRASWPLTPTRLVVFGKEVLDLPSDKWDALVANDHRSPRAVLWSSAVPK